MKKKVIIFLSVLFLSLLVGYRIQQILEEGVMVVHNIVRIHAQKGVPKEYAVAKKTTDFLEEPLYVKNGRALVSTSRVRKFRAGQKIKDKNSAITFVSDDIDLDTGMFVVKVSGNVTGHVRVLSEYTGFFLPIASELPPNARLIAQDAERMVVSGLKDGERIIVR